jgi:LysM repeat protein
VVGPAVHTAAAPRWLAGPGPADEPAPVYRVEKGDYLGHIAGRYLGDFNAYPRLARLNNIHDPNRIRPGQLLHLPPEATDHGVRPHATGLVAVPPPPNGWTEPPPAPAEPPGSAVPAPPPPASDSGYTVAVGASRAGKTDGINRPLAISAVISLASIVGAQIGAALGLRRATAGRGPDSGRHRNRR